LDLLFELVQLKWLFHLSWRQSTNGKFSICSKVKQSRGCAESLFLLSDWLIIIFLYKKVLIIDTSI